MRTPIVIGNRSQAKNDGNLYVMQDWDNDGVLWYHGEQTLGLYHQLKDEMYHHEFSGIFFAFSDEQFMNGCKRIGVDPNNTKGVLFKIPGGGFGTREGLDAMYAYYDGIDKRIREECDPQEVYLCEYNNHEGCINMEGDTEAIQIIIDTYGKDVAEEITRFRVMYTIDEIVDAA